MASTEEMYDNKKINQPERLSDFGSRYVFLIVGKKANISARMLVVSEMVAE